MSQHPCDQDFLTPSSLLRIEQACDHFENEWREAVAFGTSRPRIEDHVANREESKRAVLLRPLLTVDVAYRIREGENPVPEDYLARFPAHALVIEDVLLKSPTFQGGVKTANARGDRPAPRPEMPLLIGKYRVVEKLGGGSQGEVYRAVHPKLSGQDVVIKLAHPHLEESLYQQVINEARIVAKVEDAGLVKVLDVDRHEGRPFMVLEYIAGARSLTEVLKHERLPIPRAVALTAELAATLARVHRKGVWHRDVKPANVLIDPAGRPRLIDFGLARLAQAWEAISPPGDGVCGTFAYMAPEQARDETDRIGPLADVFSLGAVLYQLLTNRPPYQAGDSRTAWEQARRAQVIPPRRLNPRISPALERICLKALAADPEKRFASAAELEQALTAYLHQPRRLTATGMLTGVTLFVLLVLTAVLWLGRGRTPLSAELIVRVWTADGIGAQGRRIDQPGVLPIDNAAPLRVEARCNQPASVYLVALDSTGKMRLLGPADRNGSSRVGDKAGMHTILLLARRTPLPADVSLERLIGEVPPTPFRTVQEVITDGFDQDLSALPAEEAQGRPTRTERTEDPFWAMLCRLRRHFETIRYVRFAHRGE